MPTRVPLLDLRPQYEALREEILAAVTRVCDSQRYIMGPEVEALESDLASRLGVRHAVAVSSGTDAVLVALMAHDVGPGDEVVTSTYSFFATAGSIVRLGATPVLVDIDPATFNLEPEAVGTGVVLLQPGLERLGVPEQARGRLNLKAGFPGAHRCVDGAYAACARSQATMSARSSRKYEARRPPPSGQTVRRCRASTTRVPGRTPSSHRSAPERPVRTDADAHVGTCPSRACCAAEIGDVFVVNKADREGADATVRDIRHMISLGDRTEPGLWRPPVVKTVAARNEGLDEVMEALDKHVAWMQETGTLRDRRVRRAGVSPP